MRALDDSLKTRLACVVLNWRSYAWTRRCLRCLDRQDRPHLLWLVDNESDRGRLDALRSEWSAVEAIPLEDNIGYPAGMNVGIRAALRAGVTHVALINNDCLLPPRTLSILMSVFERRPDAGVVGVRLVNEPERDVIQSQGIDVNERTGRIRLRRHGRRLGGLSDETEGRIEEVDAVSGALMVISARCLQRVGLLEESYFFSFEDIEFCLRARAAGFRVVVTSEIAVPHRGGASMGASPAQLYFAMRNQLAVSDKLKPGPFGVGRMFRRVCVVGLNIAAAIRTPRVDRGWGMRPLAGGLYDFMRGRWGNPAPGQGGDVPSER